MQLDTRLDQLTRQWERLQHEHRELLEEQVLSPATLVWLGVPFVVGVSLLAGGLVWSNAAMFGWPMAVLGLCGSLPRSSARSAWNAGPLADLEECESQLEVLKSQIQQGQKEQARARRPTAARRRRPGKLASGLGRKEPGRTGGTVAVGGQSAGGPPARVDDSAAVEQLEAAVKIAGSLAQRTAAAESARGLCLRRTSSNWPKARSRRCTRDATGSLAAKNSPPENGELKTLTAAHQPADRTGRAELLDSPDPQVQLQRLSAALAEQQTLSDRRQQLRQEDRQTRRQVRKLTDELKKSRRTPHNHDAAGVHNETELRDLLARLAQRMRWRISCARLPSQYTGAGQRQSGPRVEQELVEQSELELEQLRHSLSGRRRGTRAAGPRAPAATGPCCSNPTDWSATALAGTQAAIGLCRTATGRGRASLASPVGGGPRARIGA